MWEPATVRPPTVAAEAVGYAMPEPTSPPPAQHSHSLLGWLQQLPPWLPPVLWLAGGGALGTGGLELAGMRPVRPVQPPLESPTCDEAEAQLDAITSQLVDHLTACECDCPTQ